jgi:class 3 adenylate cyclase/tetratricopeptide (TPR) repeat protein
MNTIACPSCGKDVSADFPFCPFCTAPLAAPLPAREERKVVTVLFCDLVGFTQRSEAMDPEDVRALLRGYHEHLRGELERFGGTVEKFIGDAVVAVFGAPVAHEDDPERAVRAALAIRDWAREQEGLELRIAVNTGEALVTLAAAPGEGMVAGDVVNTAARLQAAAPTNGILVGETTYRATRDRIDYREEEPVEAKGKGERVAVWEALEARARVEVERPARAELVGREAELDALRDALERVKRGRKPQLVTLVGVPGIGKSRLVYELFRSIEHGDELVYWRRGRSLPYGEGVSFWALGEIVKAQAGILESDAADVAERKLRDAAEAVLDESEAGWVAQHLAALVGAGADSELAGDRREEAFAAWRRFLEGLAEQRPTVLVFEDLHWADEGLLDFVDHLVDWAAAVRLLVVCTARPELLERRPAWGGGKVNAAAVLLSPLSDDETARLVHELLGRSVLVAELQEPLLERAGGNPLYAEEFVRLLEEERRDVEFPESVQGIIAARLDVVAAAEKRLLQDAAVAGRVFWAGELAAIGGGDGRSVERSLHVLARREFVQREPRSSVAGETQYTFRHALVREVAYGQIPRAERAEKHRRAAEWIESLGRHEDHAEVLAYHYLSALEYARAAGADVDILVDPARRALRDAGDRALALNAYAVATGFYDAALDLFTEDAVQERADLLLTLGRALYAQHDERQFEVLDAARDALLALGESDRAGEADALQAEEWWLRGDGETARKYLERAERLVRERPSSASKGRVLGEVARFHMVEGTRDDAIRVGEAALAIADELGLDELRGSSLVTVGTARANSDLGSASGDLEAALELADRVNLPRVAFRAINNLGVILAQQRGDIVGSNELFEEGMRRAARLGDRAQLGWFHHSIAFNMFWLGRFDDVLQHVDAILADDPRLRGYGERAAHGLRARVRLARGDIAGAIADVERALVLIRRISDFQVVNPELSSAAFVLVSLGRREDASPLVDEVLANVRGARGAGSANTTYVALAEAAVELGRAREFLDITAEARDASPWLRAARTYAAGDLERAVEVLDPLSVPDAAWARLRAAAQLLAEGRRAEADTHLQRALAFWRSVGATRYIGQAETLLAATA